MATGLGAGPVGFVASSAASSPKVAGTAQYALGAATRGLPSLAQRKIPQMARAGAYGMASINDKAVPQVEDQTTPRQEQKPELREDFEYRIGEATGGRVGRANGGRIEIQQGVRALMRAMENAKKSVTKSTENLLQMPDEHIAKALDVAKRNI